MAPTCLDMWAPEVLSEMLGTGPLYAPEARWTACGPWGQRGGGPCHEELSHLLAGPVSLVGVSCHVRAVQQLALCSGDHLQPRGRDSCYLAIGWKVSDNRTP